MNMKTIAPNGAAVTYVKNINIKIKCDGVIYISANWSVLKRYILQLLEKDKDRIIEPKGSINNVCKEMKHLKPVHLIPTA